LYLNITSIQIRDVQVEVEPNAFHIAQRPHLLKPLTFPTQLPQDVVVYKYLIAENLAALSARLMYGIADPAEAALRLRPTA
jgi:hypothetical protein